MLDRKSSAGTHCTVKTMYPVRVASIPNTTQQTSSTKLYIKAYVTPLLCTPLSRHPITSRSSSHNLAYSNNNLKT